MLLMHMSVCFALSSLNEGLRFENIFRKTLCEYVLVEGACPRLESGWGTGKF